jgi:hypothetical protein
MFICELFENKQLDPDIYGEELPLATVKRIVASVMKQVDPSAKISVKQSPEGYYNVNGEKLRLDFGITAAGGEISANIVNAYSSYKGAGVVTKIFGECFKAAEQLWGTPQKFVMSAHEDRGHGVWQHIAQKLGAEWEGSISEVTTVPTVAKSKREHLDVMPNDGKPIPQGDEAHYLGKRVGNLGQVEVWTYNQGPMRTFVVFDPTTRVSQLAVTGSSYPNNPNSLIIKGVYSGPENSTRAANLYAWLITKQGLTLVSDIKQSEGGQRVWQDLERRFGRYINIHGFNTKTNEPVNVGTQDDTETHASQEHLPGATRDTKDIASNVRLVASPK